MIPTIIEQALDGSEQVNIGNLGAIRDFTYVQDTCRLLADLALCPEAVGETINIGTGSGTSIGELCNLVEELLGMKLSLNVQKERIRPIRSEVNKLICDNTKLGTIVGSVPEISLRRGIEYTIRWHEYDRINEKNSQGAKYNV